MQITDLSYALRPENIACEPAEVRLGRRDLGRLMVIAIRAISVTVRLA